MRLDSVKGEDSMRQDSIRRGTVQDERLLYPLRYHIKYAEARRTGSNLAGNIRRKDFAIMGCMEMGYDTEPFSAETVFQSVWLF